VRLQELTLGYQLRAIGQRLHLSEPRFYVSGRNLHTWTKLLRLLAGREQ